MMKSISPEKSQNITSDPFIKGLLSRIPKENRNSFSEEQLLSLKIAYAGRKWGHHAVNIRGTLGIWRWKYYYVLVCGREKRTLTRREESLARLANAIAMMSFLTFSVLLGLLVIYLIKSALGIDLIPGYSLGIWDWFKQAIL